MRVINTRLNDVLLIRPEVFRDHRGEYIELYNENFYTSKGINIKFVEDSISISYKDVLRGIHGDCEAWKLVSCLSGRLYLVIVNCDEASGIFGKWQAFNLSEKNKFQVLVPPKHGVAHIALTEKIIFHYKQSAYYDRSRQFTFRWDDAKFKIYWPVQNPILSQRDILGKYVK